MKINKILVEGPDCSGKTTLVERLKNELKWDAKALHHKEGDQFERYAYEYINQKNTIFNRGHISEEVYGKLLRGGDPFSKNNKKVLDYLILNKGVIIFCGIDVKGLKKRYIQRSYKQSIKINELNVLRTLFLKAMKSRKKILYMSKDEKELNSLIEKIRGMT